MYIQNCFSLIDDIADYIELQHSSVNVITWAFEFKVIFDWSLSIVSFFYLKIRFMYKP